MKNNIEWRKYHKFMLFNGWCGQTTIQMVLLACGIRKSIFEISLHVWKRWYGTPSVLMIAYLKQFFYLVNYKLGASISDISNHIKLGHIVIVNFWDGGEDGDGHYAIVSDYKRGVLTLVDSSREHEWKWQISTKEFSNIWYDVLTQDEELYHTGLLIWIDPKSKR